jgi:GH15 family glucan-1,4-alpha-glucosidase
MEGFVAEWFGKKKEKPLHGARIEDYAVIGDCETAALVSREGSIDWLCWPTFSSGACFAALLGTEENGYWRIRPKGEIKESRRRYATDTMIVETTFVTDDGEVCLTDFMPPRGKHSDVVRIVRGVRGKVKMHMDCVMRFDYGLTIPWVTRHEREVRAVAGSKHGGSAKRVHAWSYGRTAWRRHEDGERFCFEGRAPGLFCADVFGID